jgi:CMP-N,N'-diacetyllegionaminic acid synthase
MKKYNILAIIPARKNSKRVPNKNMQLINKKPLVYYTISEALKSKKITDVVLTTDSLKIFNYGKKFKNLNVPFLRPARLAKDQTESLPVVKHAMFYMEKINSIKYDFIILLQPTCPMRKSSDIDNVINLIISKKADTVISVSDVGSNHPFRMKKILKNGRLSNIFNNLKKENMKPIQKLKKFYIRNGAIYISKRNIITKRRSLVGKKVFPYFMSSEKSINIDNFNDLLLARTKMKYLKLVYN